MFFCNVNVCKLSLWDCDTEEQKMSGTLRRKMAGTVLILVTGRGKDVISDVNDDMMLII